MIIVKSKYWRDRKRQWFAYQTDRDSRKRLVRLAKMLMGLVVCHVVAMMWLEGLPFWSAVWLTATTVTTVGYGDISASTPAGQFATISFMYIAGITLLAQVAGEYVDYRLERREKMINGQWSWKMDDHLLIINTPEKDSDRYLIRLINQIRTTPNFEQIPIQILTKDYSNGLPREIREQGVVHRNAIPEDIRSLKAANVESASYIIILADNGHDHRSDCVTLDILDTMAELKVGAYIVAEAVLDENKTRFMKFGANSVLRPVRAYPEILVRAISSPGTEQILEDLFTHHGVHAHRFDVLIQGVRWSQIALETINQGFGTALGFVDQTGKVITNPEANMIVNAIGVVLMVNHDNVLKEKDVIQKIGVLSN